MIDSYSLFLQARLTSNSTKSVTYMPGTFCYRYARSHKIENTSRFKTLRYCFPARYRVFPQPVEPGETECMG